MDSFNSNNGGSRMNFPTERVVVANSTVNCYQFTLNLDFTYCQKGSIQITPPLQHVSFYLNTEEEPQAELFWRDAEGIGRNLSTNNWTRLSGEPLPNYLGIAIDLLNEQEPTSLSEEGDKWIVRYNVKDVTNLTNLAESLKGNLEDSEDRKRRAFLNKFSELSRQVKASQIVEVSQKTLLIQSITFDMQTNSQSAKTIINFEPNQADFPAFPDNVDIPDERRIPVQMLLFNLKKLAGWSVKNHGSWTQQTIDLIMRRDKNRKYSELYDNAWYNESYTDSIASNPDTKDPRPKTSSISFGSLL